MSIKYKANISHQINQLDHILAKYPTHSAPKNQPSTPQFISRPHTSFDQIYLHREPEDTKTSYYSGYPNTQKNSIESIDDKINSIMKKHQKISEENDFRTPLGQKNVNL